MRPQAIEFGRYAYLTPSANMIALSVLLSCDIVHTQAPCTLTKMLH